MVRQVFPERTIYHESQLATSVRALCPFARRRRRRGRPGQPKGYPEGDQTGHPSALQERISCCNATTNTRKPQGNREATQTRGRKRRANLAPEGATNTAITLTTNVGSDETKLQTKLQMRRRQRTCTKEKHTRRKKRVVCEGKTPHDEHQNGTPNIPWTTQWATRTATHKRYKKKFGATLKQRGRPERQPLSVTRTN
jgi:hypothetical protein